MGNRENLIETFATNQASAILALTLLVRAISKQQGIDKEKFIADLLSLLPKEAKQSSDQFLTLWRRVLEENL